MTGEEQGLLIACLVDAGEIFPDLDVDVEDRFLHWYEVRQGMVSGEAHYKAILRAARVRNQSLESRLEGMPVPPSDRQRATPNAGTTHWETWLGFAGSWTTVTMVMTDRYLRQNPYNVRAIRPGLPRGTP